ncbi:hypothetical protein [Thiolapillus sp.]
MPEAVIFRVWADLVRNARGRTKSAHAYSQQVAPGKDHGSEEPVLLHHKSMIY